jgi:hypothetical protein
VSVKYFHLFLTTIHLFLINQVSSLLRFHAHSFWGLTGTPSVSDVKSVAMMASLFKIDLLGVKEPEHNFYQRIEDQFGGAGKIARDDANCLYTKIQENYY